MFKVLIVRNIIIVSINICIIFDNNSYMIIVLFIIYNGSERQANIDCFFKMIYIMEEN